MSHYVTLQEIGFINHNVLQLKTERPANYDFTPGQATEIAIDQNGWRDKKRPFTFTSLPEDGFLEFTIKIYPEHNGVTDQLQTLEQGNRLILENPWGAIHYKGPGLFIAGGAGVTPFIAILKDLAQQGNLGENKLLFANHRERDIIMESEFNRWLGKNFINILSDEKNSRHEHGYIDRPFIEQNVNTKDLYFYLCGPEPMMKSVGEDLQQLDIPKNRIVTEEFS